MRARVDTMGAEGFVPDLPPYKLPNAAWSHIRNVTAGDNADRRARGYELITDLPYLPLGLFRLQAGDDEWLVIPGQDEVQALLGGTLYDITRQDGAGDPDPYSATQNLRWTGGVLNTVLVLNNGDDPPQAWLNPQTTTTLEDLPNWPSGLQARVLRPFKSFLVALDITDGGDRFPQLVKWSSIADPGQVPSSWDEGDPTTNAGQTDLAGSQDSVIDLVPYRDVGLIWKDRSLWGMQFTTGQEVFRFYQISAQSGVIAPNCIANTPIGQVAITNDDVVVTDGQQVRSVVENRVRRWLFSRIDPTFFQRMFLVAHPAENQVWIVFPELGEEYPTLALTWDYQENTFGVRDADGLRGATLSIATAQESGGTWEDDTETWIEDDTPWVVGFLGSQTDKLVVARGSDSVDSVYVADSGNIIFSDNVPAQLEREGVPLPAAPKGPVDFERWKMVTEVWPRVRSSLGFDMDVYVGWQSSFEEPITWEGPFAFNSATQQKIDCRVSGRVISLRFTSEADISWALDGYDIVYQMGGRY